YRSAEYQRAKPLRLAHSACGFVIVEGYDGVQPHPAKAPPPAAMRKGYWIVHADVSDPEGYKAYMAADMVPLGKFGSDFPVRGGAHAGFEAKVRARTIVLEFPTSRAALECYRPADYQAAAALRKGKAELDLVIIEGCEAEA